MKRFKLIPLLLSISLFLTSCSNVNTAFTNFTHALYCQEISSSTINLHYSLAHPETFGITDAPITFGSFETDTLASNASLENLTASLELFPYNSLTEENKRTYDVLSYYLDVSKEGLNYTFYNEPLSPVTGIHTQLPVLLAEYQFYSEIDIQEYLTLLSTLPDYYASLATFEKEKAAQGLFMSDAVLEQVLSQCGSFSYLLTTFEERVTECSFLDDTKRENYIAQNEEVYTTAVEPAYEQLRKSLTALKGSGTNTQGLSYFPEGKQYYLYLIQSEVGTKRSISDIKTLIQNQMMQDLLDSQKILSEYPSLLTDVSMIAEAPETILQSLEEKIATAFPEPADVSVQVKYVPKSLEAQLSPAFYLIPSIDNYTENIIYINRANSMTDIHLFTTLAHEGYPGHLYQTTYYDSLNPDPIRTLLSFNGYVEGWATYAEMCSYYISPLQKELATLLQKNNSLILGLYALADIGIHYEGWSLEDTIAHFSAYGIDDTETITSIYEFILGDPANYLSYHLGYLEILELKKAWSGTQMDFHKWLLEAGPAPFAILK